VVLGGGQFLMSEVTLYGMVYGLTWPLMQELIRPELHRATAGLPWALETSFNEVLRRQNANNCS